MGTPGIRLPWHVAEPLVPVRVVDSSFQGWRAFVIPYSPAATWMFRPLHPPDRATELPPRTHPELAATRGPLRPVAPASTADMRLLAEVVRANPADDPADTVLAALHTVFTQLRDTHSHLGPHAGRVLAFRRLTAAATGQSAVTILREQLIRAEHRGALGTMPAPDPTLTNMIMSWIQDPARYVDPATTLSRQLTT